MASKLGYALLAAITSPVGGTIAGYLYAKKENELSQEKGLAPEKSEFVSAAVGFIFGPFSGLYYGYKLAETQNNIQEFHTQAYAATTRAPSANIAAERTIETPEPSQSANKWRDQVAASQDIAPTMSVTH